MWIWLSRVRDPSPTQKKRPASFRWRVFFVVLSCRTLVDDVIIRQYTVCSMKSRLPVNPESSPDVSILIEEYGKRVFMICCKILRNHDTALDASQTIWELIIKKAHTFRHESDPGTWLYSIAYREALRISRREKNHSYRSLLNAYHLPEKQPVYSGPSDDDTQLGIWMSDTCNNCMTGVIHTLSFKARIIFVFRFIIELPYHEIAEILDMQENAVRQAAQRARKRIASFLSVECGIFRKCSPCRCGLERYLSSSQFRTQLLSLKTITEKAWALHDAGETFPPLEYWEKVHARCHKQVSSSL